MTVCANRTDTPGCFTPCQPCRCSAEVIADLGVPILADDTGLWFAAWECGCTDVAADPADLDYRCPCHDVEQIAGPEPVTPGVSTNHGHLCPEQETTDA